jgi:hypothetical protein
MQPYLAYMVNKTLPEDVVEARRIVWWSKSFYRTAREVVQEKYNRRVAKMCHPSRRANHTKGYPRMSLQSSRQQQIYSGQSLSRRILLVNSNRRHKRYCSEVWGLSMICI